MKLTSILILTACLHVGATGHSQKVTLNEKNVSLEKVFRAIHKQTGFQFVYNDETMKAAKPISIVVSDAPLEEVLALCFKDQPLDYFLQQNAIVVRQKVTGVFEPPVNLPPIDISGKITDGEGNSLMGATVSVKGTNLITKTNVDGFFALKGVDESATLEISYVGFEKRSSRVLFFTGNEVVIALKRTDSPLDVVQVEAYRNNTKRFSTSNISTVKAKDIENSPVNNLLLAIQGRVPGISITQTSGLPGSAVRVTVGSLQNSINSGNEPFYVIDGVPYFSTLPSTGLGVSGNLLYGNPLFYINPGDIESIDILKDADATAIYGSRAANGAMLITTKKGKVGKVNVDIGVRNGWGKVTQRLDMMDSRQYLDMRYEAYKNDGIDWRLPSVSANDLKVWDTTRNVDWQDELIGGTAKYLDITSTVSGGTANLQWFISGAYHNESSVFSYSNGLNDKKGSVFFKLNSNSQDRRFTIQFSGNYITDNNKLPRVDLTSDAFKLPPIAPVLFKADGSLNWAENLSGSSTWDNPLRGIRATYENSSNNLISNLKMSYRLFKGFEITNSLGYTIIQTTEYAPTPNDAIRPQSRANLPRFANFGNRNLNSWIWEPQLDYDFLLLQGRLQALAGCSFTQSNSSGENLEAKGQSSDQQLRNISAATSITSGFAIASEYKYNALFGRISGNWFNKYLLNLNVRRDGSSRFGPENRFHNFWSVGAAWIFSSEKLFQNNVPGISFGKLKCTYGTTGNDQIGDYSYYSLYIHNPQGIPYQNTPGIFPFLGNPYLQWEVTRKFQVGLDLGFLKDKFIVSGSYSRNRSSNQVVDYTLPVITGFRGIKSNFPALVQNSSWEFTLTSKNVQTRSFNWTSNLNFTIPRNQLVDFPDLENTPYQNTLIIGQPLNVQRIYNFAGVDPLTGGYTFLDSKGNPTSTSSNTIPDPDTYLLINTFPEFYGGFQNSINFRSIHLDFLFHYVKQVGLNIIYNNGSNLIPGRFNSNAGNQPATISQGRWQKPGDIASYQSFHTTTNPWNSYLAYAVTSNANYTDASFIRLKNVSLTLDVPEKWCKKASLRNCKVNLQAQNLVTFSKYKGLDPESQGTTSLPPMRVITFGLQFGF